MITWIAAILALGCRLPCTDYVVAHELVHIKIPNHSHAFWRMLDG